MAFVPRRRIVTRRPLHGRAIVSGPGELTMMQYREWALYVPISSQNPFEKFGKLPSHF